MQPKVFPRFLGPIALAVAAATHPAPAHALLAAGWDFSQYLGDGLLTIDGVNGATTLDANYSSFDPTHNAGAESADYGTMYIDGSFGSSTVDPLGSDIAFVPSAEPLESNLNAPVQEPGDNPFDSFTILADEGQMFTNLLSMIARSPVDVVFAADIGPDTADEGWSVTFGGKTSAGSDPQGTTQVTIEFSTDGTSYTPVRTVTIDAADTAYAVNLTSEPSETAFVRFGFDPESGVVEPLVDNVAIQVPEPDAAAQLAAAAAALLAVARRRR